MRHKHTCMQKCREMTGLGLKYEDFAITSRTPLGAPPPMKTIFTDPPDLEYVQAEDVPLSVVSCDLLQPAWTRGNGC